MKECYCIHFSKKYSYKNWYIIFIKVFSKVHWIYNEERFGFNGFFKTKNEITLFSSLKSHTYFLTFESLKNRENSFSNKREWSNTALYEYISKFIMIGQFSSNVHFHSRWFQLSLGPCWPNSSLSISLIEVGEASMNLGDRHCRDSCSFQMPFWVS